MSLIQSARLNGHDTCAYRRDALERLPLTPGHRLEELLPHVWKPVDAGRVGEQLGGIHTWRGPAVGYIAMIVGPRY